MSLPAPAVAYVFYVGLTSQADTKLLQNNPTLASGDVLVSTDGGATSNLDTLPVVTPASSDAVKVSVSVAEMTGEDIVVIFSDASGAEWADKLIHIKTSTLGLTVDGMTRGTVIDTVAPTNVQFECDDITEATADHFKDRNWLWTTGALKDQMTAIEAYALVSGRGRFTVTQMTEAPANNDEGVVV